MRFRKIIKHFSILTYILSITLSITFCSPFSAKSLNRILTQQDAPIASLNYQVKKTSSVHTQVKNVLTHNTVASAHNPMFSKEKLNTRCLKKKVRPHFNKVNFPLPCNSTKPFTKLIPETISDHLQELTCLQRERSPLRRAHFPRNVDMT